MTRMLDVLEQFLNYHGHIYLRLDGSTRVEMRQVRDTPALPVAAKFSFCFPVVCTAWITKGYIFHLSLSLPLFLSVPDGAL